MGPGSDPGCREEMPMIGSVVRRAVLLAPALVVLGFLLGARTDKPPPEKIIKKWKDGPVRYILSSQEEEVLRGLKSIEDLARFITDFWARRDPTAGTFENEFRRMFWQRVAEANRRFRVSTTPGWKTDRGKIFVILGEPFDIETNTRREGTERWSYRRRHSKSANPEFYVVFKWSHGDLVLDSNPQSLSPFYDFQGAVMDPGPLGIAGLQAAIDDAQEGLVETTSIQAGFDLGDELIAATSNTEVVLATVSAREFVSAFAAAPRFEFFRAKDGATFVNICGLMKAADLYGPAVSGISRHRMYASLSPLDASAETRFASNERNPSTFDLSKGPEPGGVVAVWTGVAAPPGRYKVTMAIEDSLTGRLGRATADVDVPDFSGPGPSLSTPVLASALAEAKDRMSVASRSSGVFHRSEEFGVYFEVYGLLDKQDPPRFDVSYRFHRETHEGVRPIGQEIVMRERTGASQGWSFPLASWPPGKYVIRITVTGTDGRSASTQAPFEVVE